MGIKSIEPILPAWFRIRNNIEVKQLLKISNILFQEVMSHHGHVSISKSVKIKQNINLKQTRLSVYI